MKLADINKELLKALNGPAPQHKVSGEEAFEFSEGSDGALHAKIVDHLGNPISNTNKLQVADADVKTELEQIKQTQQQILHRLDEPIDTQLTGSNEEEILFENEIITAGSSKTIIRSFKGKSVGINVRLVDSGDISIAIAPTRVGTTIWLNSSQVVASAKEILYLGGVVRLEQSSNQIRIQNIGENDVEVMLAQVTDFL